ncbi:hypothetical protein [Sphingobium sp. SCG-1]|uniref:hypothetical protein n=1 Tax=Sphingobium sp. SCG-1 TaxID=2072936 RepID=UPI001671878B|nr:hypothetical protein [Sphingobium sp. SCG-1]
MSCAPQAPDQNETAQAPVNESAVNAAVPPPRIVPATIPPLDRQQLLAAIGASSDAFASRSPVPEDVVALAGRPFQIKLPFGCNGPSDELESNWAGWSYDSRTRALKLTARVEITKALPMLAQLVQADSYDAVEGFWIRRPWTSQEVCPRNARLSSSPSAVTQPDRQTVGFVQLFGKDDPRTLRRGGRPYAATIKLDEGAHPGAQGYQLSISGRIGAFSDRQPIHCTAADAEVRPVCLVAVELTRVAFDDPESGVNLSEWAL